MWVNWPFTFSPHIFHFIKVAVSYQEKLNSCVCRLRQVKIEKRILADQGNSLVDLCKVREASECIVLNLKPAKNTQKKWQLIFLLPTWTFIHNSGQQRRCKTRCLTCCRRCRAAGGSWTHTSTAWRSTWRS